jgi:hypothetical protein
MQKQWLEGFHIHTDFQKSGRLYSVRQYGQIKTERGGAISFDCPAAPATFL